MPNPPWHRHPSRDSRPLLQHAGAADGAQAAVDGLLKRRSDEVRDRSRTGAHSPGSAASSTTCTGFGPSDRIAPENASTEMPTTLILLAMPAAPHDDTSERTAIASLR